MKLSKRELLKLIGSGAAAVSLPAMVESRGPDKELPASMTSPESVGHFLTESHYDAQEMSLYDSITFRAGQYVSSDIRFFGTTCGQLCPYSCRIKTTGDTDMWMPHKLPAPCMFFVRSYTVGAASIAEADKGKLARFGWDFRLLDKLMQRGPMLSDMRIGEATAPSMAYSKGTGLFIPTLAYFEGAMQGEGFVASDRFTLMYKMDGIYWRAIQ